MTGHRSKILRLAPNRVWRTYSGGLLLDRMEGRSHPADGEFPEDWLGSTVRAVNPGHADRNEGLAHVIVDGTAVVLADLIATDPEYFLGTAHLSRFGANPMMLVKYLDGAQRLPFQVHPTIDFSRQYLNTSSGKTEAYYILETRPEVQDPFIYLGFQRPPTRAEMRRMIVEQDIVAMEKCFDKIRVRPGDVYVVPGGLPHAIGGGILMVELMEPTDFVARVEFDVGGRVMPEAARFMGRDVEFALDMFSFDAWPITAVQARWRGQPQLVARTSSMLRESLVDGRLTDCFCMTRTALSGVHRFHSAGFGILLVIEGSCSVQTGQELVHLSRYDRIVVPYGLGEFEVFARDQVVLLESSSPS